MCKVFKQKDWNDAAERGEIVQYGYYHRYYLPNGERNPDAVNDIISKRILDVKDKQERGLNFFYNELDSLLEEGITLCVVPPHEASEHNESGIAILARRLARNGRIDKTDFLLRNSTVSKLATGGTRNEMIQRDTIKINSNLKISGDVVLLMDDVTTTGISLNTCRNILMEAGADSVAMLALGKAI